MQNVPAPAGIKIVPECSILTKLWNKKKIQRCRSASSLSSRLKICSISLLTEYFKFFLISKANVNEHEILGVVCIFICQTGFSPTDIFDKFKEIEQRLKKNLLISIFCSRFARLWYFAHDILTFWFFFTFWPRVA